MKALRGLMKFCVEAELIEGHPTEGIKRARTPKTGGFHTWTEPEIAKYEARHPIGTCERLGEALLLYTALGRSDIVRFGPQHVQGSRIELRKTARLTGKTLRMASHPALAEVIAGTPCNHLTLLVTAYEKPLTAPGFGNWFRECCDAGVAALHGAWLAKGDVPPHRQGRRLGTSPQRCWRSREPQRAA